MITTIIIAFLKVFFCGGKLERYQKSLPHRAQSNITLRAQSNITLRAKSNITLRAKSNITMRVQSNCIIIGIPSQIITRQRKKLKSVVPMHFNFGYIL